jgi:phosphoglycolate phosphatase
MEHLQAMQNETAISAFLDLDGTLLDSRIGIIGAIRHALTEIGAEAPRPEELGWCVGPPLREIFSILLGDAADIDEAVALYREHYDETGKYEADVYDGVGEMLMDLQDMGAPIYLVTSKLQDHAQDMVEHFGIHAYLDGLFGSEPDGTRADKTDLLTFVLEETGSDPARCFMLGDRRHDVLGARNNAILSVGALWGYGGEEEMRMAEADLLVGTPEELTAVLADVFQLEADA